MLNKNILASISFVAGAVIGSATTYFIVNKKAQEKINFDTNETRKYYKELEKKLRETYASDAPEKESQETCMSEKDIDELVSKTYESAFELRDSLNTKEYKRMAKMYNDISTNPEPVPIVTPGTKDCDDFRRPYVIPPDDFGEYDDYDKIFLTMCNDGVIVDEDFDILDRGSLDDIGVDYNMKFMGEYEDDILHIRNEKCKTDFEITKISDNYKALTYEEEKEDLEE